MPNEEGFGIQIEVARLGTDNITKQIQDQLNKTHNFSITIDKVNTDNIRKSIQKAIEDAYKNVKAGKLPTPELSTSGSGSIKVPKIEDFYPKGYKEKLARIEAGFRTMGQSALEVSNDFKQAQATYRAFEDAVNSGDIEKAASTQVLLQKQIRGASSDLSIARNEAKGYDKALDAIGRVKLGNYLQKWLDTNTAATKEARMEVQQYFEAVKQGGINTQSAEKDIRARVETITNEQRAMGRLGNSLTDTLSKGVKKFAEWGLASGAVMQSVNEVRQAVNELKEVDTLLTEISKANENLSSSELKSIGGNSFGIAGKYGKRATDYLSGVQEMSRAGYKNAEGMAELSTAAQGAGDMTADLANQYIIATDKAYKLNGSVEKLTTTLDGVNYITNNNAVNMTELADAMSVVGSTAASFGVEANEATAAVGTMIATTQQSGSEAARAFRAILLNIRQVSDEEEGIDAEGLTKYEEACNALNVKLKETKDGVQSLRDPMEVLRELSIEYNKLDESDVRRANLLSSLGGKLRSTQLDALLRQWDMYEKMLQEYAAGGGSMAREAEKTANSWEGSLNRLSNTWTSTVNNFANTDAIIIGINTLNEMLGVVNKLTSGYSALPTIVAVAYTALSAKGRGGFEEHLYNSCSIINYSPFLATVKFSSDVYEFCAVA